MAASHLVKFVHIVGCYQPRPRGHRSSKLCTLYGTCSMYIYYTKRQWKFSSAIHIFRSSRAAGVVRACVLFSPLLQPFYRVCVGVLVSFLLTCAGIPGTNRVRTRYKEVVGGWKDIERFLFKWLSKWFREWFKKDSWRCSKDAYLSLHASYPHLFVQAIHFIKPHHPPTCI